MLAIGNPFQLSQTVTLGIVSALRRSNIGAAGYEDFIQTDAAINPGNSGGALINSRGELVGINTAIYSQSGGYQGIGFAVPSNLARKVMDDLVRMREVRRGYLGYFETILLTADIAAELGVSRTRGIVVNRMDRTSAAYGAGMRPGDVILTFESATIEDGGQLQRLIADAKVGTTVRMRVERGSPAGRPARPGDAGRAAPRRQLLTSAPAGAHLHHVQPDRLLALRRPARVDRKWRWSSPSRSCWPRSPPASRHGSCGWP